MSALSTQLALRAHEMLSDGEWHNYESVVRELGKLVPPGIAKRRNERERLQTSHKIGGIKTFAPEQRVIPRSIDEQVNSGRRAIVREHLKNRTVYETDQPGRAGARNRVPDRRVRMIGKHRAVHGNPTVLLRDKLTIERDQLRDDLDAAHAAILDLSTLVKPEQVEPQTAALVRKLRDAIRDAQ